MKKYFVFIFLSSGMIYLKGTLFFFGFPSHIESMFISFFNPIIFLQRMLNYPTSSRLSSTSKLVFLSMIMFLWNCKIKRCPFLNLSFSPHLATMPVNNSLNRSQTNTCSGKFSSGMQSLKCAKKFLRMGHIKTSTIVAHKIYILTILFLHSELYVCCRML